jgi:dihydropyrimidine dehydrogenase (NAD+) subunit PreT
MSSLVSTYRKHGAVLRVLFVWTIGTLALAGIVLVLIWHWDYYGLTRLQRPIHDDHYLLRPSGLVGLVIGIGATTLFILNLGYLVRKQLIAVPWLGSLRSWMDAHVVTGLIGTGLIALHSAMAPSSALGVLASVALAITVATGIVGRTIYIQVPRSLEGRELELKQVQNQLDACRHQLQQAGVQAEWLHLSRPPARTHRTGLVRCFLAMAIGDHQRRQDYRRLKRQVLGSLELESATRQILPLAKAFCIHWQWLIRYHELRSLIASWRFFHRWLAVLLFCVVICHIALTIRFGDLVLWGGAR